MGARLPKCSSPSFPNKVEEALPAEVREALLPLVRLAEELSDCIKAYDERIEKLGREKYEHTELLLRVKGVRPLTWLAYVLTLENPDRFAKSREVGPFGGDTDLRRYRLRLCERGGKNAKKRAAVAVARKLGYGCIGCG
jgi:hypothetical protein